MAGLGLINVGVDGVKIGGSRNPAKMFIKLLEDLTREVEQEGRDQEAMFKKVSGEGFGEKRRDVKKSKGTVSGGFEGKRVLDLSLVISLLGY